MRDQIEAYLRLSKLFSNSNFNLYLVGGCVRDMLLKREFTDIDLTTDATPEEMKVMFPEADFSFAKYGSVRINFDNQKFEVTTLRIEKGYSDSRHPNKITFTKSLKLDVKRRDFTINALYMDDRFQVYDFVKGRVDLSRKTIRTVGLASRRFKEDPLRIIRAIRFAVTLDFNIDRATARALMKSTKFLAKLNAEKVKEEIKKIPPKQIDEAIKMFKKYDIYKYVKGVLE